MLRICNENLFELRLSTHEARSAECWMNMKCSSKKCSMSADLFDGGNRME